MYTYPTSFPLFQLSKVYKDTVLQGTYNSTLDNPLVSSTDGHSPQKMTKKQSLVVQTSHSPTIELAATPCVMCSFKIERIDPSQIP